MNSSIRALLLGLAGVAWLVILFVVTSVSLRPQDVAYEYGLAQGFESMCIIEFSDTSVVAEYKTKEGAKESFDIDVQVAHQFLALSDLRLGTVEPVSGVECPPRSVIELRQPAIRIPDLAP